MPIEKRESIQTRKTRETDISIHLNLDGEGRHQIDTGVGFFDHMLTAFCVHGGFDLDVKVKGDLEVDCHHTVEDTGIVLGKAFAACLGDRGGIERYGSFFIPMDEALSFCSADISGRPFLVFDAPYHDERIGGYDCCMTEEFFRAFSMNAGVTLHLKSMYGKNDHHIAEALYKAAAHALRLAVKPTGGGTLSTKGVL
ncbi:imidazoleglycerol-phosphate dehydratase HisB [Candidatus Soleaferrea massiliensis]|uniref:imidazoleglycerol-phosphate dehydratase HisB n=1 Tax=Candidatus Soleaferrea massiliensis TaxID=1470354 RepID=UPI00058CE89F|nr:imidazoleglycerol-phosphate dehydratase HisB [Candidatus Soleaferrea massiliensis]